MNQLSMFEAEEPASPTVATADPARVRRKLDAMLAEAREAGSSGLPASRRRFIETVMPQMLNWLPEDEARRVRHSFEEALAA